MISIGRLEARDRSAWEELFAGYHAFYGRPDWPRENYDEAWRRFQRTAPQSGVLFEIVDRAPGYAGHGAANALVRMAAQESAAR